MHIQTPMDEADWHQQFERLDPFIASRAEVEHLLATAPTPRWSGYLEAVVQFREQLAAAGLQSF